MQDQLQAQALAALHGSPPRHPPEGNWRVRESDICRVRVAHGDISGTKTGTFTFDAKTPQPVEVRLN